MRITVDLDDELADECATRAVNADMSWSRLIADALTFALVEADEQQAGQQAEQRDGPRRILLGQLAQKFIHARELLTR